MALGDINNGGDEVIIRKKGFSGPGRSTGKSFETRYFEAGKYRIRAERQQVPGKPLSGGNPMALAVRIRATFKERGRSLCQIVEIKIQWEVPW